MKIVRLSGLTLMSQVSKVVVRVHEKINESAITMRLNNELTRRNTKISNNKWALVRIE
jgi:hypothetical protein